ncbi:MAG: hypothetical protein HQK89_17650, partial [Nitrospirae bacterium]|nr:hypothetical protein [Nitrospirota bacterium]
MWTKEKIINDIHKYALERLDIYNSYLSSKISNYATYPKILSEIPYVIKYVKHPVEGNNINEYLLRFNESIGASVTYIMNKHGTTIASSNYNSPTSFVGQNYSFREYFKKAIKGIPDNYIAIGATSKLPGYYISYPIKVGKEIIAVATVKYNLELFTPQDSNNKEIFIIVDNNNIIFHSTYESYEYHTIYPLPVHTLQKIKDSKQYANKPLLPLSIIKKSQINGLTFITIGHSYQSKIKKEYADVDYLIENMQTENGWHVYLLVEL